MYCMYRLSQRSSLSLDTWGIGKACFSPPTEGSNFRFPLGIFSDVRTFFCANSIWFNLIQSFSILFTKITYLQRFISICKALISFVKIYQYFSILFNIDKYWERIDKKHWKVFKIMEKNKSSQQDQISILLWKRC